VKNWSFPSVEVNKALAEGRILPLVDAGLDLAVRDKEGRSLLHFAAAWGDIPLCETLLRKGASALTPDLQGVTPLDAARAFGNDAVAEKIAAAEVAERAGLKPQALPHKDMDALRSEGALGIYRLIKAGRFGDVTDLARRDGGGLAAGDLLTPVAGGDTALMALAQQRQLDLLLDISLWVKNPGDAEKVWAPAPADAKKGCDYSAFSAALRQTSLKGFGKFRLKGPQP